jgi:3-oxoacyl-[acyl-carrier-protein] synthase-3
LIYASIRSVGAYIPERVLTNKDLESIVDTTDEWILKRTGISTRYIADESQSTSDLAVNAAKVAIDRAGIQISDVDMIVCATITPDYFCMPSTACVIADKLGIKNIAAFDISAACSGFIYALSIARVYVISGMKKNVLIIGAETLSRIVDYEDRTTCVLFGDGAGAAIISATDDKSQAVLDVNISSDGEFQEFLMTPSPGSKNPCSVENIENRMHFMKMKGNETFKVAVRTLTNDVVELLEKNNTTKEQIKHFIPHQANHRIIAAVGEAIGLSADQVVLTVAKYGNTSAASIPMAMNEIYEQGKLKNGDLILLDAFGGGLTWGSALAHFAGK